MRAEKKKKKRRGSPGVSRVMEEALLYRLVREDFMENPFSHIEVRYPS